MTFQPASGGPGVPIGGIVPFHKDFDGSVTLPAEFEECDGTTINDADSPLDGVTKPDLQGQNRHIRGNSTSGGTGGASSVSLSTSELANHDHFFELSSGSDSPDAPAEDLDPSGSNVDTSNTGGDSSHPNEPPYFDTVMAMRVK